MRREEAPAGLLRPAPGVPVGAFRVGAEPGQVGLHAFDRHRRTGEQCGVARAEPTFLLEVGRDRRVERGDIGFPQPHRVRAGQCLRIRHGQQAALHRHLVPSHDGGQRIGIFAGLLCGLLRGVLGEPQMDQGAPAIHLAAQNVPCGQGAGQVGGELGV